MDDPSQDEFTAAVRETREETGFWEADLNILTGFSRKINYLTSRKKKKSVTFWLAELQKDQGKVRLSSEHCSFKWTELDEALKLLTCDEMKPMLKEAVTFIRSELD